VRRAFVASIIDGSGLGRGLGLGIRRLVYAYSAYWRFRSDTFDKLAFLHASLRVAQRSWHRNSIFCKVIWWALCSNQSGVFVHWSPHRLVFFQDRRIMNVKAMARFGRSVKILTPLFLFFKFAFGFSFRNLQLKLLFLRRLSLNKLLCAGW